MKISNLIVAAAAFAACTGSALAFRSGPPAGFSGSPGDGGSSCLLCHAGGSGAGAVEILGAPANYAANQVYDLQVRISDPGQVGGGFELTVEDSIGQKVGTLIVTDPARTQLTEAGFAPEWISHNFDGVEDSITNWAANGNSVTFSFQWQAPASDVGAVTFYAVGNAINNDFNLTGDNVYLTNVSATFGASCPADLDGDGQVNASDLATLLGGWGSPGPADLDGSGVVGSGDLAALLGAWGPC
jgi:hypothetical protein